MLSKNVRVRTWQESILIKNRLRQLDSTAGQRELLLQRENQDAHAAWVWYQGHRDEFKGEIFGPPILSCSVNNMRVLDAVEHLIGGASTVFTCQNTADYDKFSKKVFDPQSKGGLGLANVSIKDFSRSDKSTLDKWPTYLSAEKVFINLLEYFVLIRYRLIHWDSMALPVTTLTDLRLC